MDFIYLKHRARESSGLPYNPENAIRVRKDLDTIMAKIELGVLKYAETFPRSQKAAFFTELEKQQQSSGPQEKLEPKDVNVVERVLKWHEHRKSVGEVTGRTLYMITGYIENYIEPFFRAMSFAELNKIVFEQFAGWARNLKLRGKSISNNTLNKMMVVLRMTIVDTTIEHGWGGTYDPFFGFKRPKIQKPKKINPFFVAEQRKLRKALPKFWRPYFDVAFRIGLRQGEQRGLEPGDINWDEGTLTIQRAATLDVEGKRTEGKTKNEYSRRTIKLKPLMLEPLLKQKEIHDRVGGKKFFSMEDGSPVDPNKLRADVWFPALQQAQVAVREMKQTRHSFATNALAYGENPGWIAAVLGHANVDMVIRVYMKYVEDIKGTPDGDQLAKAYAPIVGDDDEDDE
jgi:integrase